MASTSLFAPIVRAVQPAFIYPGGVDIYFSLSVFNTDTEVKGIKYIVTDPNIVSSYGSNSVIKGGAEFATTAFNKDQKDNNTGEYYFTIDTTTLKTLKYNQYYQVQIYLLDKEETETSKAIYSAPSQVSLIRPIGQPTLWIDGIESGKEITLKQIKNISGNISYGNDITGSEKEYLAQYKIEIYEGLSKRFDTGWIQNINGLEFFTKINYNFAEGKIYILKFYGKTINDYPIEREFENLTIEGYSELPLWNDWNQINTDLKFTNDLKITNDLNHGAIKIKAYFPNSFTEGTLLLQRADETDDFSSWTDILKLQVDNNTATALSGSGKPVIYYDYLVPGDHTFYQYRFIQLDSDENGVAKSNNYLLECVFEDMFLYDLNRQFAVRYNPNITGFKWVVQESVTNTLGGAYPLIRRNGETKYRQFNLSGTIYFDPLALSTVGECSCDNIDMSQFFPDESSSLFINVNEALGGAWQYAKWNERDDKNKLAIYEKHFKDIAMDFLTDGKPKIFKSPTEGLMIVKLTNISFTPNKTLGRRVVDFSATVNEFAEVNEENLERYGLESDLEFTYYVLEANSSVENANYFITPFVSENKIIEGDTDYYLKLVEKAVKL